MAKLFLPGRLGIEKSCEFACPNFIHACHGADYVQNRESTGRSSEVSQLIARAACSAVIETERKYSLDPLTGLFTKDYMRNELPKYLNYLLEEFDFNRHLLDGVNLAFIDLDGFKAVNDACGHDGGDEVLVLVAKRLKNITRENDFVCRWGGDEFLVVAPDIPREVVTSNDDEGYDNRFGKRLVGALTFAYKDTYPISASVGVVSMRAQPSTILSVREVDTVIKMADTAMYQAKRQGKQQSVTHELDLSSSFSYEY